MFGSQVLDTGIGLAMLFFVLATAASGLLEAGSRLVGKRSRDLRVAIGGLLSGKSKGDPELAQVIASFQQTSAFRGAAAMAGRAGPAHLTARTFADAAIELMRYGNDTELQRLPLLGKRLYDLNLEARGDIARLRAGLEHWYDEAMARSADLYRRFSSYVLFGIGFGLAVLTNASMPHVAASIWNDPVVRDSVVAAAQQATTPGDSTAKIQSVAQTTDSLNELALPVGWTDGFQHVPSWWASHVIGWLLTAVFVMLGAPFWFDLLTRLLAIRGRSAGSATAADIVDQGSSAESAQFLQRIGTTQAPLTG